MGDSLCGPIIVAMEPFFKVFQVAKGRGVYQSTVFERPSLSLRETDLPRKIQPIWNKKIPGSRKSPGIFLDRDS